MSQIFNALLEMQKSQIKVAKATEAEKEKRCNSCGESITYCTGVYHDSEGNEFIADKEIGHLSDCPVIEPQY